MSQKLVVASQRASTTRLVKALNSRLQIQTILVSSVEKFSEEYLKQIDPQWIFVPYWHTTIPKSVWHHWPTVIFHMTDLPYGRGGSPLQNLILRGHTETALCAFRCTEDIDGGPVYMRKRLSLDGNAEEILTRADKVIEGMITTIVLDTPDLTKQQGAPVYFSRRKPEESDLLHVDGIRKWYDHIRMLDADEYPQAFLEVNNLRIDFRNARFFEDKLIAEVEIVDSVKTTA